MCNTHSVSFGLFWYWSSVTQSGMQFSFLGQVLAILNCVWTHSDKFTKYINNKITWQTIIFFLWCECFTFNRRVKYDFYLWKLQPLKWNYIPTRTDFLILILWSVCRCKQGSEWGVKTWTVNKTYLYRL